MLPRRVRLGYQTIPVEVMPIEGANGVYHSSPPKIIIHPDQPTREEMNSLIHELLHAVWDHFNLPDENEEHCVTSLANGVTELLCRNPKLREYLCQSSGD